jgi:dynein heavy chain
VQYSDKVHGKARDSMNALTEYMRVTGQKLSREVTSLDSLRFTMTVLREVRERESSIEMEFTPILDMYAMLESYLPGGYMDTEEMDAKSVIRSTWRKLVDHAEQVSTHRGADMGGT